MNTEFDTAAEQTEVTQDQTELNERDLDEVDGGLTQGTKPKLALVDYF
jgi:hypothetical protein